MPVLPSRIEGPQSPAFRFDIREFAGSLGDLGTLLPITFGLIAINGLHAGTALALLGISYIAVGAYYRLPVPVQPLKAAAMIAIATGATLGEIKATALLIGAILLVLGVTRLADRLSDVFPKVLIKGMQFGLGVLMIDTGLRFMLKHPAGLGSVAIGAHAASATVAATGIFPPLLDFQRALFLLVLPQLPLTLGNAVLATHDCAGEYFGRAASRVNSSRLATTIGLGNLAAGLVGGVPMCHGAGGLTAHYRLGARSGAAPVMLGALLLTAGSFGGYPTTAALASVPASILGILLAYVGFRHAGLAKDAFRRPVDAVVVLSVGAVTYLTKNLLLALVVGFAARSLLEGATALRRRLRYAPESH